MSGVVAAGFLCLSSFAGRGFFLEGSSSEVAALLADFPLLPASLAALASFSVRFLFARSFFAVFFSPDFFFFFFFSCRRSNQLSFNY